MPIPDSPTSFLDKTVFIDTNLGTHLAMAVSDGDTVSDVKGKIEKEHPLCFPHVGNIKVHAIKVARGGFFYHLSDFMYLKSAFVEFDCSWFLSINASVVDGHLIDPNSNTGNLSTCFERAADTSVDGINLAGNNHCGQVPNYVAPQLQEYVTQQYVNDKSPTDIDFGSCHSSRKDLMIRKAEVTHSVENCSKDQSAMTRNGCEGLNERLESLPAVKVKHKSKKKKMKLINGHEVVNRTPDDKDHNPLKQVVGSGEQLREHAHNEVSDLPIMGNKPNIDERGLISSSNTRDESKHGMKRKYNLSEETDVDEENDKSKKTVHLMDSSSLDVAVQSRSTAKKLRTTGSGVMNGVEGSTYLVSDSSKATSTSKVTSEYLSDKKQTSKVVRGSLSTEPDASLLQADSSDVKKRRSKLSGCPSQADGLISSRVGDQREASRESDITTVPSPDIEEAPIPNLLGTSVRERHGKSAENFASSLVGVTCGIENSRELGDVQSIRDVSDKAMLGVKRTIGPKDFAFQRKDFASQRKDPAGLQKTISSTEDLHNVASPEDRGPMQNTDTKTSMVENCYSSSWDGTDANIKASLISESEHRKGSGTTKNGKKKKTKKSRDPVEDGQINLVTAAARDSAHNIPPTDPQSITSGDNSHSKAEIGENTTRVSILPNDRNTDMDKPNISQVEVEPLLQINKNQAVAEDMDGQVRKKIKKRHGALMKSSPDLQAENIANEDSLASKKSDRELKSVSMAEKKTEFSKVSPRNEIEEANLDSMLFSEVESNPSFCKKSKAVVSSLTPSHVSEGCEGRSLEENRCSNSTKDGTADNVDKHIEVSSKTEKVSIVEKADELQHESVKLHVDKLGEEKIVNTLPKAKIKKKNPSACSSAASLSMQSIHKSDTETGGHCQTRNSSALKLHGSSSMDKCDGTLHVDNQLKKISEGGGVKSLPSNEHKQKISDSNKANGLRGKVVDSSRDSSEKYSETSALPKTRLKSKKSPKMVHRDKKEGQSTGIGHPMSEKKSFQSGKKDVTESQRRSLMAITAGIFKDGSSDSFEDKGGIVDSDASTRSPDNSLTSDFSDGESNGNMNSSENGFVDLERTNSGGRSIRRKGPSSSPENMSLDTILRSSSRYKKAKLTATQLEEDAAESQPVDFVPDSQALA